MTNAALAEHRERLANAAKARRIGHWEETGKCTVKCRLNPVNLGNLADFARKMFEDGEADRPLAQRLTDQGYVISSSAVGRHRKVHLYKKEWHDADMAQRQNPARPDQPSTQVDTNDLEPVENIAALRKIIAVGMQRINTGKITPELVVKAIDLEERLTRGTKTNALMDAISSAFADDEEDENKMAEVVEGPMERSIRLSAGDRE